MSHVSNSINNRVRMLVCKAHYLLKPLSVLVFEFSAFFHRLNGLPTRLLENDRHTETQFKV